MHSALEPARPYLTSGVMAQGACASGMEGSQYVARRFHILFISTN
jgi:hypothetical protein